MKQSLLFAPTLKEAPKDAEVKSHKLMMRAALAKQNTAGVYTYLPLGYKVLRKIENIVREELNALGCSELLMPVLQSSDLWSESGRWDKYGPELFRLKDRKERDFCLGPTHEEVITSVVRDYINSYKKMPLALYQIQTKFRDEMRPRFGLMRGREFSMKDLYTFTKDEEDLDIWYQNIAKAYKRIYERCGLNVKVVESDTGQIGGDVAHEFMVMSEVGEDDITYCETCDYGSNVEYSGLQIGDSCPVCGGKINVARGIEVGNIFKLGTKYSEPMNCTYIDKDGKTKPVVMGCYGIGISRTLMAVVEENCDDFGLVWPSELKPFDVHIVPVDYKKEEQAALADQIYRDLSTKGFDCLLDDRMERAGVKFKDSDLIGIPKRIVVGKKAVDGIVEIKDRKTGELVEVNIEEIVNNI